MKQNYESPDMDVIELDNRDAIVASPGPGEVEVGPEGPGGWQGGLAS